MEEVIKLPETVEEEVEEEEEPRRKKNRGEKKKAEDSRKRSRPRSIDPGHEEALRRGHVELLAGLKQTDESVRQLEDLVFGGHEELLGRLGEEEEQSKTASLALEEEEEEEGDEDEDEGAKEPGSDRPIRAAAWVDDDDELQEDVDMQHRFRSNLIKGTAETTMNRQRLQERMREQFMRSMGGTPSWADGSAKKKKKKEEDDEEEEEEEEDEDDLMRRTGNYVASSDSLPSGILRMKKCLDANSVRPSADRLTSVQFHPTAAVVMTAGLDQSLSLFQVDGKTNPQIQSIHLERFPVHKAAFSADGEAVIATSFRNRMFYLYDMIEGRVTPVHAVRGLNETRVKEFSVCPQGGALLLTGTNGYLHMMTLKTKEVVSSVKMNGNVSGVAFSQDGSKIFTNSEEGEVYVWDIRSSRCLNRFTDDGCVRATSIAASPNGQYLACGSESGVVNIYSQTSCLSSAHPRPLKAVMNLVTTATALTFNPQSEILAVGSRAEDEAVRLVHLPSCSVFSNFPVSKKKQVYRVSCFSFSPHSGFLSLANNKGHAPLYRLLHYKDF